MQLKFNKAFVKLTAIVFVFGCFLFSAETTFASLNPTYNGIVRTQTGAPIIGASVRQTSYSHPYSCTTDENGNPTGCYDLPIVESANRYTASDGNGAYYFDASGQFNCISNPQIFRTTISNGTCQEVADNPGNFSVTRTVDLYCTVTPVPTPTPTPNNQFITVKGTTSYTPNGTYNLIAFTNQTIQLLNSSGVVIGQVLTDTNGKYSFTVNQIGDYRVKDVTPPPAGYTRNGLDSYPFGVRQETNGNFYYQALRP